MILGSTILRTTRATLSLAMVSLVPLGGLPAAGSALANDSHWSTEFAPVGFDGAVLASTWWQGHLVVGGRFASVNGVTANYVALRDGDTWVPLGTGLADEVNALAPYGNDLVAGGKFTNIDGEPAGHLAAWDGSGWRPLGTGTNGPVYGLVAWNGVLVIVGYFDRIGLMTVYDVGWWDGTNLSSFPHYPFYQKVVRCAATHDGSLYVGGNFTPGGGVVRWTGTEWVSFGPGFSSSSDVRTLRSWAGKLVAGGSFHVNGPPLADLAAWDGASWQALPGSPTIVSTLGELGGRLVAAGLFQNAQGVVEWDGVTWTRWGAIGGPVYTLASSATEAFAGGSFATADGRPAHNLARWNGATWSPAHPLGLAPNGPLVASTGWNGSLVVAGTFDFLGEMPVACIAKWNGASWESLGVGLNGAVAALTTFEGDVVAGGSFNGSGSTTLVRRVARWDGVAWTNLGEGFANGQVTCLADVDGALWAGGSFSDAGGHVVHGVARWNGASWESLGVGLTAANITGLASYGGDIVAAGQFSYSGTTPVKNVARWDGATWASLGGGANLPVSGIAAYRGDLVVGGSFTTVGGVPAAYLARWDGANWHRFGGGPNQPVTALTIYRGDLLAAGLFTTIDGVPLAGIGRWNGGAWSPLESGIVGSPATLAVVGPRLWVGGDLSGAGGNRILHLTSWTAPAADLLHVDVLGPDRSRLYAPTPNPSRSGETTIRFALPAHESVTLAVYDVAGRRVRTLVQDGLDAGSHSVRWDGRGTSGAPVSPGIYFVQLRGGDHAQSRKLLVLR